RNLDPSKLKGTLTVAFVAQQWLGGRGLQRLLFALKPDEVIYVGRLMRAPAPPAGAAAAREPAQGFTQAAGNGGLLASPKPQAEPGALGVELKKLAAQINVAFKTDYSAPLLPRGASVAQLPERTVHLAVASTWPSTPGEIVDGHDVAGLNTLLQSYFQGETAAIEIPPAQVLAEPAPPKRPSLAPSPEAILKQLIETYRVTRGDEANAAR